MNSFLTRLISKHKVAFLISFFSLLIVGGISSLNTTTTSNNSLNKITNTPVVLGAANANEATQILEPTFTVTLNPTIIPTNTIATTLTNNVKPTIKSTATATPKKIVATNTPIPQSSNNKQCKYSCLRSDGDINCSNFSSQSEAQVYFNCCGFTATNDPMGLDGSTTINDGLACNSYKYKK